MNLSAALGALHTQLTPEFAGTLAGLGLTAAAFFLSLPVGAGGGRLADAGRKAISAGWFFAMLLLVRTAGRAIAVPLLDAALGAERLQPSSGFDVPDVGMTIEVLLFLGGMYLFLGAFAIAAEVAGAGRTIPAPVWDLYRRLLRAHP